MQNDWTRKIAGILRVRWMRVSNLKSHQHIIFQSKNDNSRDLAGSWCSNCQSSSRNSRSSEGILISCTQNRKQHLLSRFPFHLLSSYLATSFSLLHVLVHIVCLCVCVYMYRGGTSSGRRISLFLLLPQFSLRLLLFSGRENEHESWALFFKHRFYESLLWYLSVVRSHSSPLSFLSHSLPPTAIARCIAVFPLIFCSWVLDVKTDV